MKEKVWLFSALIAFAVLPALAQTPRISALFPAGAKAGETVEVSVRGGNLAGAKRLVVIGPGGVTADLAAASTMVDEAAKPLFQQKCQLCHELRSPANRTLTPEQWAATVDRMINARSAPIAKDERDRIVGYLQSLARAGQVTARLRIAPDAAPGMREVRVVTDGGGSTAYLFEVGTLPEITATEPNSKRDEAQKVTLPVIINGTMASSGERDFFAFEAKKGQRLTFNLKGFRLNEQSQAFFNPALYLYDASGRTLAKSHGYFDYDPLIDWTVPADGTYTVLVRDLLWRGSPASVYRLAIGSLTHTPMLFPGAARPGATFNATVTGLSGERRDVVLQVPANGDGILTIPTPLGEATLLVRDLPDGGTPIGRSGGAAALPALFRGRITQPNQVDTFRVAVKQGGSGLEIYARRLGSPLRARVSILDDKGKVLRTEAPEGRGDVQLPNAFPGPGEYFVEVRAADGNAGPDHAYYLEATDGAPDFALEATPDSVSVGPGGTAALLVRATRRQGLRRPIVISVNNLPPGVTASPALIPPDDDKVVVTLTAQGGTPGDLRVVSVEGQTDLGQGRLLMRRARPIEIYRTNNQPRPLPRSSQVVALAAAPPPFTLSLGTSQLVLTPNQEIKIPVKILRQETFKADLVLTGLGVPPGIAFRDTYVPAGQTEASITIQARADAPLLRERPNLPPMRLTIVGTSGDITCSSAPLTLVPAAQEAKP